MLTARADEQDKLAGLETGADDPKALTKFRHPEGYKYDRSLSETMPNGIVLSMVRPAQ